MILGEYKSEFPPVKPFAPWWARYLARLFGERVVSPGDVTLIGYRWCGSIYVWKIRL